VLVGALLAVVPLLLTFSLLHLQVLIGPGVAWADDGGGHGGEGHGGSDSGGDGNKGSGSDNSGSGSSNSGSGGGDDGAGDDNSGPGGDDDGGVKPEEGDRGRAHEGGRDFVANELLVSNLSADARDDVRRLGFSLIEERALGSLGLTVARLRVPRNLTTSAARARLIAAIPGLLVDVNSLYRLQGQRVLPAPDYARRLIGWGPVAAGCGKGLRIGLLDTRIDTSLGALRDALIEQRSFLPAGLKPAPLEHGTALAAILVGGGAAGGQQGLLPGARLMAAEVVAGDADGVPVADLFALSAGLDWLVSEKVPVVNLSLAGGPNALLTLAVQRVVATGTVLVASAGNDGPMAPPAFPAAEPGVIAVTAVDSAAQAYDAANRGAYIDFAAPGVQVWTPGSDGAGRYNTGTSYAAPFVAAAVAAGLGAGMSAGGDRVTAALAERAVDLGAPGKDPVYGWGLVQAAKPCLSASAQSQ
jgi:hypothetical protein